MDNPLGPIKELETVFSTILCSNFTVLWQIAIYTKLTRIFIETEVVYFFTVETSDHFHFVDFCTIMDFRSLLSFPLISFLKVLLIQFRH